MIVVLIVAGTLIVGEFAVIVLLLRFVRTFGSYAPQLVEIHKTNVAIHQTNIQIQERQERIINRLIDNEEDAA